MRRTFFDFAEQIFQNPLDEFYIPWYFLQIPLILWIVQIHPQDVVVFILNTASPWIIPERSTAPQHTRFMLPPIHSTKSSLRCRGGIFLFRGRLYLENFMSRPNVISAFLAHAAAKQGQELRSGQPGLHICKAKDENRKKRDLRLLGISEDAPGVLPEYYHRRRKAASL